MTTLARRLFLITVLLVAGTSFADQKLIIAVPEFQNKSDRILHISRWDLAVWTANDLKKTGEFSPIDRKKMNAVVKDAVWDENRLREGDEEKLRALSAKYALYGTVRNWDFTNSSATGGNLGGPDTTVTAAAALVIFSFDLVDLETGRVVQEFLMDGSAIGGDEPFDRELQPDVQNDKRYEQIFEDASKLAIRKATKKIAEFIAEQ